MVEEQVATNDSWELIMKEVAGPEIIAVYKVDSLVAWSSNRALPDPTWIPSKAENESLLQLKNGYYYALQEPLINLAEKGFRLVCLFPVQYSYALENEYLRNEFEASLKLPDDIKFQQAERPGTHAIKGKNGKELFYVINELKPGEENPPLPSIIFFFGGLILLFSFCTHIARNIARHSKPVVSVLFLFFILLAARLLLLFPLYPELFRELEFFNPQHYAASDYIPSLGDLLINTVMLLWIAIYFIKTIAFEKKLGNSYSLLFISAANLFIFLSLYYITNLVGTLVNDSNISFDVINFLSLSIYSIVGLTGIFLLFCSLFLVSYRLVSMYPFISSKLNLQFIGLGISVILFLLYLLVIGATINLLFLILAGIAFILLLTYVVVGRIRFLSFTGIITFLLFFALYTAFLLNDFNTEKEWGNRKLFSNSLIQEDYLAEYAFSQVRESIMADTYIQGYFKNPLISRNYVVERLNLMYFKGQLGKYDVSIHTYLRDTIPYKSETGDAWRKYYNKAISAGQTTIAKDLYYFPNAGGNYEYLALLDIYHWQNGISTDYLMGKLVIEFSPKSYNFSNVYPELLLAENIKPSKEFENYGFAVYSNNKLIREQGEYPYNIQYQSDKTEAYMIQRESKHEHLIYMPKPGESIWVTGLRTNSLARISYFSYIFAFYLLLVSLAILFSFLSRLVKSRFNIKEVFEFTFRNKIQVFVTFIILSSFFMIGLLTITHISRQYNEYHHQRLLRKVKQVLSGLEYLKKGSGKLVAWEQILSNSDELFLEISSLSDIHSMDINLYDKNGFLLVSSQPDIFSKGLLSKYIDPVAFHYIGFDKKSQYIQNEQIGKLDYLSVYVPIMDKSGTLKAILNLPYFAKEKNLNKEITDFLIYFINIYVLLLVLAGLVGVIVSKSVTRPIFEIGEKLKRVTLSKKNEPISWGRDDEIGKLVNEYNKMINELEQSADLLAKSEREIAWREMAKQVAHEIKNPLTPMKLSIQHLQRASRDNSPSIDQLIEKVTSILIEQIDNLSEIASEFSSFAKMPPAQRQELSINDIVRSIGELYKNESVELKVNLPVEHYQIYADKGQLLRVFNNLVKNAIQAIPDGRHGKIFIGLKQDDNFVMVKVEDNGTGISTEEQDKVFAPNFTTKGSGMGLGLAISKNIIESAGGEIWFESKPGIGTTFFVKLPIHHSKK